VLPETRCVLASKMILLAALALALACSEPGPRPDPGAAIAPLDPGAAITARDVELRLPQPGGDVLVSADTLSLAADRGVALEGGVRVRTEGGLRIEATADRASLAAGGRIAVLEGRVRASLALGDAGVADE
jgi:hypothetical protein